MKYVRLFGLLVLVVPVIVRAQARVEFAPVTYCAQVEQFSSSHQPKIFALMDSSRWAEFSSPEKWKDAGRPMPLALVWQRGENTVRVAVASQAGTAGDAPYSDYCYRTDGALAMSRLMPQKDVECDASHVRCQITLRGEEFCKENGEPWKPSSNGQQMQETEMLDALDSWELRPESETVSFDPSVPQVYLRVSDLPFYTLLAEPRR